MNEETEPVSYVLTMTCPDRTGIVAAASGCLSDLGCFMTEASYFADPETVTFFGRQVFHITDPNMDIDGVRAGFGAIAKKFQMNWRLHEQNAKTKLLIMVTRAEHCLNDILYRYRSGTLNADIPAIVSNHPDLKPLADWHDIPFHHLPVTRETKSEQEARVLELFRNSGADYLVLARYMQVLSTEMCDKLSGRAINIHHSFLPGFKGAKPYHQAHARGVKLIGATAHFVTQDLDEGPIIEQQVQRVDHTYTPEDLAAVGRETESQVLSRALGYLTEHRVLPNGSRTVVFR